MNILDEQKQELTDVLLTKHFIRINFIKKKKEGTMLTKK